MFPGVSQNSQMFFEVYSNFKSMFSAVFELKIKPIKIKNKSLCVWNH